jgi:glycosyltransferase involved in cell wall biosynthesis
MDIKNKLPLVTVAVPVYNEETYIGETLDSILRQNYSNLEILISDNHSTDKTGIICREYAKRDHRIRYYCHDKNTGAAANHIYLSQKAQGKYFMFAAGHDLWSENFVFQSVMLLENTKNAMIAFGTPLWIGKDGKPLARFSGWYDTRGLNPVARFFMVFWGSMNPILGLFKRKDMPDLRGYNYVGGDLGVLGELSLKGEFIHAANTFFYRRQNRSVENYSQKVKRYKDKEMQIVNTSFSALFPLLKLPVELLRIVMQAKISAPEKILIFILLLPSFPARYILGKKDNNLE